MEDEGRLREQKRLFDPPTSEGVIIIFLLMYYTRIEKPNHTNLVMNTSFNLAEWTIKEPYRDSRREEKNLAVERVQIYHSKIRPQQHIT